MAVKICTKSGSCFTCVNASMDDVEKAVKDNPNGIFCCHQRYQGGVPTAKKCVRVADIDTWEEPREGDEEPDEPGVRILDLSRATTVRVDYR